MSLVAGTRLGPYEIQAAIGAGGMGEVYKARDTRLDRSVAIKILPAELSADPDRRTRFEREARAVAALSHPHICTLYDIGSHPSTGSGQATLYLVMEYLAGETLAERLRRGPVPVTQALELGAQIAEALDAAHKHGIIHRDLKPGNVMLTTGGAGRSGVTSAKLLDFGLAKLAAHGERPALAGGASVPTQAAPVTAEGTILGTLQYMAPEQLEGKEADARTDLWALGAILYEMVTDRRAFEGESQVSLIGNIMNAEPIALATLQPLTPPALERVVKKCLAKHPDDRWDTAHDVADELRWIAQTSGAGAVTGTLPRRRRVARAALTVAGGLAMAVVGAALICLLRSAPPVASPVRLSMDVRPAEELNAGGLGTPSTPAGSLTALTWTPDGRSLVFVGRRAGVQQLYVRPLDAAEARPLANTEGAQVPAVSPDGQWVAFWARGAIRKVRITGGPATEAVPGISAPPWGLAWDAQGGLYFSRTSIWSAPAGGKPVPVTTNGEGERVHVLPSLLPGGRVLVFTVRRGWFSWGDDELFAQTLATGTRTRLLKDAIDARYVPTGHLVFMRLGVLYAVPFDPERLALRGPEAPILEGVTQGLISANANDATGAGQFAISPAGTLAWISGPVAIQRQQQVVTVNQRGQVTPLSLPVRSHNLALRLSPDGRRLALSVRTLTSDSLWVYDLERGAGLPLTQEGEAGWPLWSPDGRYVLFGWTRKGVAALWMKAADGMGEPEQLAPPAAAARPASFTPDGVLATVSDSPDTGRDILVGPMEHGKARLEPLLHSARNEQYPEFSPDGRWLVFGSDMSGRPEIYVQPYPGPGAAVPVSVGGGSQPAWHPNSLEIFFVAPTDPPGGRRMMAVTFAPGSPPRIGRPRELFETDRSWYNMTCGMRRCYDVSPDGQRFYAFQSVASSPPPLVTHVDILQNWFEELKAKVPATR